MARVNGKAPPPKTAPKTARPASNRTVIGCGAPLGGYIDQGVPKTCGSVGLAGKYLCGRCADNARSQGMETIPEQFFMPATGSK